MIKLDVPHFVDNTKDKMRCVQACLKMILKYFLPQRDFNWKQLDRITHKVPKKGTWWFAFYPELLELGFEVATYRKAEYFRNLLRKGLKYLYEVHPKRVAEWYLAHSNIKNVMYLIPIVLKKFRFSSRRASLKDVTKCLRAGYLLIADVNARTIHKKSGFASHAVVVTGFDRNNIYINDPANEIGKNMSVPRETFLKAWHDRSLVAFRLKQ
jgi:ABC-type bacteriocin/lantibiotic exporter with double-glycine peptidase domain